MIRRAIFHIDAPLEASAVPLSDVDGTATGTIVTVSEHGMILSHRGTVDQFRALVEDNPQLVRERVID